VSLGGRTVVVLPPSDRRVALDIVDPAGHRLLRTERQLDEHDPREFVWLGSTLGPSTVLEVADEEFEGEWTWLYFGCKTCRDQGREDFWTQTHTDVIRLRLDELWRSAGDTPKSGTLTTSRTP
jgi:hypothetical protein